MNENRVNVLARSQVFKDLPQEVLEAIAKAVNSLVLPKNSIVFRESTYGDSLYIIESGSVRVFRKNDAGMDIDLSIRRPGESFGEVALITGEARTANVETLEETSLMVLAKDDFDHLIQVFPDINKVFFKEMRSWLIKDASRLEVQAREAYKSLRMSWIDFFLIMLVSLTLAIIFNYSNPNGISVFPEFPDKNAFPKIKPAALMEEARNKEILILDAGPTNFYKQRHIKGAISIPLSIFDIVYLMTFSKETKGKKIAIYGGTISRPYDLELANKLALRGHEHIKILEGGMAAWEKGGYPVEEKAEP